MQTELPGTTPQKVRGNGPKIIHFIGPLDSLKINQQVIEWTSSSKLFGVTIDN